MSRRDIIMMVIVASIIMGCGVYLNDGPPTCVDVWNAADCR